jgi:hypothetical protein
MVGEGGGSPPPVHWVLIDTETGEQLPGAVTFIDRDEAARYHQSALDGNPRYEPREAPVPPPPFDPGEPRVW